MRKAPEDMTLKGDAAMDPVSVKMNLMRMNELPETVAQGFSRSDMIRQDGFIYIRSGDDVLRCADDAGGEAVIRAMETMRQGRKRSARGGDPWLAVLNGDIRDATGIRDGIRRCLILFEAVPGQEKLFSRDVWDSLAPVERGDAVTEPETGRIALIKMAENHSDEEIAEFAAAVIETVETETGIQIQAGVGSSAKELAGMKESWRQAGDALATGRLFQPEDRVFVYSRQVMERLIRAIPEDARTQLRKELFSPETGKMLNPEMMETIRAFFRNDLNLSTTARELFIHRNTLIYRLDKIRKETGFDLRHFRDAAVFQMLSRIPEEEKEN